MRYKIDYIDKEQAWAVLDTKKGYYVEKYKVSEGTFAGAMEPQFMAKGLMKYLNEHEDFIDNAIEVNTIQPDENILTLDCVPGLTIRITK